MEPSEVKTAPNVAVDDTWSESEEATYLHIFFQRKQPQTRRSQDDVQEKEALPVKLLAQFLNHLVIPGTMDESHITCIGQVKDIMEQFAIDLQHPPNVEALSRRFKEKLFPSTVYIPTCNCALLVWPVQNSEQCILQGIQSQLSSAVEGEQQSDATTPHAKIAIPTIVALADDNTILERGLFFRNVVSLRDAASPHPLTQAKANQQPGVSLDLSDSRGIPSPSLVFDYLIPMVSNSNASVSDFPRFFKVVKTEANYDHGPVWRRSALWHTTKSIMHSAFESLLPKQGTALYKCVMIQFMTWLIQRERRMWIREAPLFLEYMQTVSNRINKLPTRDDETALVTATTDFSVSVFQDVRTMIDAAWKGYIDQENVRGNITDTISQITSLASSSLHFGSGAFEHDVSSVIGFINEIETFKKSKQNAMASTASTVDRPKTLDGLNTGASICARLVADLRGSTKAPSRTKLSILDCLSHIELSVQRVLWPQRDSLFLGASGETTYLLEVLTEYLKISSDHYKDHPLEFSTMALTGLALVAMSDLSATRWDKTAQFSKCRPPVDLLSLQTLLLTRREELDLLQQLEEYFSQRLSTGTVDMFSLDAEGLANKYCEASLQMESLRERSLQVQATKEQARREAYRKAKQAADELQKKINNVKSHESGCTCAACTLGLLPIMTTQLNSLCMMEIYERELPEAITAQRAVLFHNEGPIDLLAALWCYSRLESTLHGSEPDGGSQIASFWPSLTSSRTYLSYSSITFASSTKPKTETHFKCQDIRHYSDDSFIVTSSRNLAFFSSETKRKVEVGRRKWFDKLKQLLKVPMPKRYRKLEWILDVHKAEDGSSIDTVDENEVIANQANCPSDVMSVQEYLAFGTTRSGGFLQLRSFLQRTITSAIDLNDEHILTLLQHILLQVGPPLPAIYVGETSPSLPVIGRAWNVDVIDSSRGSQFCDFVVEKAVEPIFNSIEKNWDRHTTMHCIVLILSHCLKLRPDHEPTKQALRRCRTVVFAWMTTLRGQLAAGLSSNNNSTSAVLDDLRARIVRLCAIAVLTFTSAPPQDTEAMVQMITGMVLINDNMAFPTVGSTRTIQCVDNKTLENLVQLSQRVVWSHEVAIHGFISQHSKCILDFVLQHWTDAALTQMGRIKRSSGATNILYYVECRPNDGSDRVLGVCLDPIFGRFLINGMPVKRLPENICGSSLFRRTFGSAVFEVQPSADSLGFVTSSALNGSTFSFMMLPSGNVCITQKHSDRTFLLLDHSHFVTEVPWKLSNAFSHWFDYQSSQIAFRPVSFLDPKFNATPEWIGGCYPFAAICLIRESASGRLLVSIGSDIAKRVASLFGKLDLPQCVHVLSASDTTATGSSDHAVPILHLPRLGLSFAIKENEIECIQFGGMKVAKQQFCGALCGLEDFLMLSNGPNRRFIVSNAEFSRFKSPEDQNQGRTISHHRVRASFPRPEEQHREHRYFSYEIDDDIGSFKSNAPIGEMFLAYLHALTAYPLAEPFTRTTGLEACLESLSRHESNKPFDDFTLDVFGRTVGALLPIRRQYPQKGKPRFCTTKWPAHATPNVVSDFFVFFRDAILTKRQELGALYGTERGQKNRADSVETTIHQKYFLHDLHHFPPQFRYAEFIDSAVASTKLAVVLEPQYSNIASEVWNTAFFVGRLDRLPRPIGKPEASFFFPGVSSVPGPLSVRLEAGVTVWSDNTDKVCAVPDAALTLAHLARTVAHDGGSSFCSFLWFCGYLQWRLLKLAQQIPHWVFPMFVAAARSSPQVLVAIPPHTSYSNPSVFWDQKQVESTASISKCGRNIPAQYGGTQWVSQAADVAEYVTQIYQSTPTQSQWQDIRDGSRYHFSLDVFNQKMRVIYSIWRKNYELQLWAHHQTPIYQTLCASYAIMQNPPRIPTLQVGQFKVNNTAELPSWPPSGPQTSLLIWLCGDDGSHLGSEAEQVWLTNAISRFEAPLRNCLEQAKETPLNAFATMPIAPWQSHADTDPILQTSLGREIIKDLKESWVDLRGTRLDDPPRKLSSAARDELLKLKRYSSDASSAYLNRIYTIDWELTRLDRRLFCSHLAQAQESHPVSWWLRQFVSEDALATDIRRYIAGFAACITYSKKATRCLMLLEQHPSQSLSPQLLKEISFGRSNLWAPKDYPSWLVFEVEQGLVVRDIQVQVAKEMLRNPTVTADSMENRCLQLQMGEGKTSVILPLLCLALSQQRPGVLSAVARITVLPSLFPTFVEEIQMRIGGILRRPVFSFPFQRIANTSGDTLPAILRQLKRCREESGVIVTVPEHRLSFLLKWKLSTAESDPEKREEAQLMDRILKWQDQHCFDFLDESDELLRHRFQLLYPFGAREGLDGGSERWRVAQEILQAIWRHGEEISGELNSSGELKIHRAQSDRHCRWSTFRVLDVKGSHSRLVEIIYDNLYATGFFDFNLSEKTRALVRNFVLNVGTCATSTTERSRALEAVPEKYRPRCLTLRGLLSFEVLTHVLAKRCTVDYGLRRPKLSDNRDHSGSHPIVRMAVPYRAKDVASERSEFGHPDVAILTTHLSYYHVGLTFSQFTECLRKLISGGIKKETAKDIYEKDWLEIDDTAPESLRVYECINLADAALLHELYGHLGYNVRVINFWLSMCVLPNETRQFPKKLFASAWDLVGMVPLSVKTENYSRTFATRGFSGTNDSRFLLPSTIAQHDLPKLKMTNADVIDRILSQESSDTHNQKVHFIPAHISGKQLLNEIISCSHYPRVLLDPGALMVALSNQQVAQIWLDSLPKHSSIEAAVFFNENDVLCCLDRSNGSITPLELSPYKNRLESVIVYLDDHHTRGTDLKLPIQTHAAVTLCTRLPKEKLMQACMRLRQLGARLQTVCFWAPYEVQKDLGGKTLLDVITWSIRNTVHMLAESMLAWASQGMLYSLSQTALIHLRPSSADAAAASQIFLAASAVPEVHQLMAMYNTHRQEERTINIVMASAIRFIQLLDSVYSANAALTTVMSDAAVREMRRIHKEILDRCDKYLDSDRRYSNLLDEEQERELDQDKEVEAMVQLPGSRQPAAHVETGPLRELLLRRGTVQTLLSALHPLSAAFQRTCVARTKLPLDFWHNRIFVTSDYLTTVKLQAVETQRDEFVRIPHYCVSIHTKDVATGMHKFEAIIMVSHFEANWILQALTLNPSARSSKVVLHQLAPFESPSQLQFLFSSLHFPLLDNSAKLAMECVAAELAVFSGSKFFPVNDGFHLRDHLQRFLGCFLRNSALSDSQSLWKRLRDLDIIDNIGFINWIPGSPLPDGIDADLINLLQRIFHSRKFSISPAQMLRAIYQLRKGGESLQYSDAAQFVE